MMWKFSTVKFLHCCLHCVAPRIYPIYGFVDFSIILCVAKNGASVPTKTIKAATQ
jgi:hypothetical protein